MEVIRISEVEKSVRIGQLLDREGILAQILDEYEFSSEEHKNTIETLYEEIVDTLNSFGVREGTAK